ncbi:type II methionyl aminopeptidase [Candidatus Woesearchaeota archaeon]|nr:type II methionyl aminopeptidase [Candidatus Woesearchaeota archaeon]
MDFKENLIKAGKIVREAREYAKEIANEKAKYIEVAEKVEKKISDLGGKCAFPVDVSVNHIAAHDTPLYNDERVLVKGDLVKVDLGVHVDGYIADTAVTVEIGTNNYKKLIGAAEKALNMAVKLAVPNSEIFEIGKVIQEEITSSGFTPIKNLSGHGLKQYQVHTEPAITNYNNNDKTKLKEDMIIAIEPFATTGQGLVTEGKNSGIYELVNLKNTRNFEARKILKFVSENYNTLPFCNRWIIKEFGLKSQFLLKQLENEKIIQQFAILPEKAKGMVSQAEHTILVGYGVVT